MTKANITQYDSTPSNNADINDINIAENCPASNINNAIRELMAHLKNVDTGSQALTSPSFTAMSTDTISEKTSANGVAIDSVTLKDGELGTTASPVPINSSSLNGGQFGGRRNIVINGAMQVAQRGTSFSLSGTADTFITDRFLISNSDTGAWTASQSTDSPTGFSNSLKMDCTTADTSPTFLTLMTRFEGQDLQHLKKGTSSAEKTTLSFFVKSNKTGTYIAELRDIDNNRTIGKAYTISSADTWEQKIITFDGDTTGAFDNDNGNSLTVQFYLAVGSVYNSGTLATSWGSRVNANTAVGQVNLADSTDNEWYITGIQLEVGSVATPFEHRSFGEELALCQRYYFKIQADGSADSFALGSVINSTTTDHNVFFPVQMRSSPTAIETSGTAGDYSLSSAGTATTNSSVPVFTRATVTTAFYRSVVSSGLTAGNAGLHRAVNSSAFLAWSSEL